MMLRLIKRQGKPFVHSEWIYGKCNVVEIDTPTKKTIINEDVGYFIGTADYEDIIHEIECLDEEELVPNDLMVWCYHFWLRFRKPIESFEQKLIEKGYEEWVKQNHLL